MLEERAEVHPLALGMKRMPVEDDDHFEEEEGGSEEAVAAASLGSFEGEEQRHGCSSPASAEGTSEAGVTHVSASHQLNMVTHNTT
jgi:hypothetical protein